MAPPQSLDVTENATLGASQPLDGSLPVESQSERIGRYIMLHRLGAGSMGVVLAAYDPKLDRKVALKLLKAHHSETARARLEREAQALAKLAHPNQLGGREDDAPGAIPPGLAEQVDQLAIGPTMEPLVR